VDEAQVSYLNSNEMSQAVSGYLKITSIFAEASIFFDANRAAHGGEGLSCSVYDWGTAQDPMVGEIIFDTEDMVKISEYGKRSRTSNTKLYCLAMTRKETPKLSHSSPVHIWVTVLLLERMDEEEEEVFRRVGVAYLETFRQTNMLDNAMRRRVIIK